MSARMAEQKNQGLGNTNQSKVTTIAAFEAWVEGKPKSPPQYPLITFILSNSRHGRSLAIQGFKTRTVNRSEIPTPNAKMANNLSCKTFLNLNKYKSTRTAKPIHTRSSEILVINKSSQ